MMKKYFKTLCYIIAIVCVCSYKGVKGQNNTKEEYSSIWDFFSKENSKPFTLIADSLKSYTEKEQVTEFIFDIDNRKINVSFEKSKKDSVLDLNIRILDKLINIDSFLFIETSSEFLKEDLLTSYLVLSGFTDDVFYSHDDSNEYLLFTTYFKEGMGTWKLPLYHILISFNEKSAKIYVIYDFSGMLRGNSFGDFNNDNVLDFIFIEMVRCIEEDYSRTWVFQVNRINIDKNLVKDSLFIFKSDRYGQGFEIIK